MMIDRDLMTTSVIVPGQPYATLLVNARNGFNELSRKAVMWTVRHRWPSRSRFAFNCY